LVAVDRLQQLLILLVARKAPWLDPAPAVAEQIVVAPVHPAGDGGVEFEGGCRCGHGDRDGSFVDYPRQAPDAGPASVVEV